jgi:5-methylcytosine-specific restriction protein A
MLSSCVNLGERSGCSAGRPYSGFLGVHHILGAGKSDRVHHCVALSPNCHREAHVSPERDALNRKLLNYAKQFQQRGQGAVGT